MRRIVLTAASALIVATAVTGALAQQDVIKDRQNLMKQSGQQTAVLNRMVRGQEDFDGAKVNAAFDVLDDKAKRLPDLFPAESRTGETRAHPRIWEDAAGFKAEIDSYAKDVAEARAAAASGLDGLKASLPAVTRHCGSCHEAYRLPKG